MWQPTELALLAMVCFGISDLLYKRAASAGVKPMHFIASQTNVFFVLVLAYGVSTNTIQFSPAMMWNAAAGFFMMIGFFYFFRSLSTGAVSINGPIFRLNFVVSAVFATLAFREPLSFLKVAAILFACGAVWLLLGFHRRSAKPRVLRGLADVAVATIAIGVANVLHKVGLMHGVLPGTAVFASAGVFCSLATLLVVISDRGLKLPLKTWKYSSPAALALVSAFLLLLNALMSGQASVLIPIAQMGFVIPATIGMAFLGEDITPSKVGGLGSAIAALGSLSMI